MFRTDLGRMIFREKYAMEKGESWKERCSRVARAVCGGLLSKDTIDEIAHRMEQFKFLPGGRYIYYGGRPAAFYNNCFCFRVEDSREGWAEFMHNAAMVTMSGGGVGADYSLVRASGTKLSKTGGIASGPIMLMQAINDIGRSLVQGGSRRSAMMASLNWQHKDIMRFIEAKRWDENYSRMKSINFDYPAPLDQTNISVNFDNKWLKDKNHLIFDRVVDSMCRDGEPGMTFNFKSASKETLRNPCGEFISELNGDSCNLASLNLAAHENIEDFKDTATLVSLFLICGSSRSDLPLEINRRVREEHRKIGVGLMGVHEWLLLKGYKYEVTDELKTWLAAYRDITKSASISAASSLGISRPKRFRAVAPTGTLSILAGTTSGIEPLFAVATKRRYLVRGTTSQEWKFQYEISPLAKEIINITGMDPNDIETAYKLASEPERRIKFQADVQDYVDMGISSTVNLPEWGSEKNNENTVAYFADIIRKYAERLRGITTYPNGARAGQPLTEVEYSEAEGKEGVEFTEFSDQQCKSGVCSI